MTLNDMTCHIENDTVMSCHVMSCHTDMTFTKFTSHNKCTLTSQLAAFLRLIFRMTTSKQGHPIRMWTLTLLLFTY